MTTHTLSSAMLIRWGGLAAVLAGVLRVAASFSPSSDPGVPLELLYMLIDLAILFGILGIYGLVYERAGWTGLVGFVLALSGTAIITGPDGKLGPVQIYPAGSALLVVGLAILAVACWSSRALPRWVLALWVLTTATGFLGAAVDGLFPVSGITFGVSFVGAGAHVWLTAGRSLAAHAKLEAAEQA